VGLQNLITYWTLTLQEKRSGHTILDSDKDVKKVINWGDEDQYHKLSCYYIASDELAMPFQLPQASIYLGTNTASIYDPVSGQFRDVETDKWQYTIDGTCTTTILFLSGKAVPVQQQSCSGETVVYYDFELGQPDGSLLSYPPKCYPFQTCGQGWNTCKDPYCCNDGYNCTLCG